MYNDSLQLSVYIPIGEENSPHMHEFQSCSGVLDGHVLTVDGKTASLHLQRHYSRKDKTSQLVKTLGFAEGQLH